MQLSNGKKSIWKVSDHAMCIAQDTRYCSGYVTSRKVTSSGPDEENLFYLPNPSG